MVAVIVFTFQLKHTHFLVTHLVNLMYCKSKCAMGNLLNFQLLMGIGYNTNLTSDQFWSPLIISISSYTVYPYGEYRPHYGHMMVYGFNSSPHC